MEYGHDQRRGLSGKSGNALIRGSYWNSDDYAGAFNLNNDWPDNDNDNVGFR
ncbi:hypothetical protein ACFQAT_07910 [Undibacterium arcticum]|uniref:hypothetical protein n=1 Tax=Undibacterium arcticum TaxID=1762892 RepID=UPI00361AC679